MKKQLLGVSLLLLLSMTPFSCKGGTRDTMIKETRLDISQLGGEIIFASTRSDPINGRSQIYLMNADGSGTQNISRNNFHETKPAWSPDGRYIAFESVHPGKPEENGIYIMDVEGNEVIKLPRGESNPAWSPNGQNIAFCAFRYTDNTGGTSDIYISNSNGDNIQRLTNSPTAKFNLTWSPNGKQIAFGVLAVNPNETQQLYIISIDSKRLTQLTYDPKWAGEPAWSPDGEKIAFVSARDGNPEIYLINADGTGEKRLTRNRYVDACPAWSPNGEMIIFASLRHGRKHFNGMELYVMRADGTGETRLTRFRAYPDDDRDPEWRIEKDGRR